MTMENNAGDNQTAKDDDANKPSEAPKTDAENPIAESSGDPGRTPGSAEGDEETIDEDIREKEAEGKL